MPVVTAFLTTAGDPGLSTEWEQTAALLQALHGKGGGGRKVTTLKLKQETLI